MNIAVDLDGVLADIHRPTADRSDELSWDEVKSRDFDEEDWTEYKHVSQNLWHNHWDEIPLMEDEVVEEMSRLTEDHEVTVLTHRCNVVEKIERWLHDNGIAHDELICTHDDKSEYDFDLYVDDNPVDGPQLLRDQPWNQDVDSSDRIFTIIGVSEYAEEVE